MELAEIGSGTQHVRGHAGDRRAGHVIAPEGSGELIPPVRCFNREKFFCTGLSFKSLAEQIGVEPRGAEIVRSKFACGFKCGDGFLVAIGDVEIVGVVGDKAGEQCNLFVVRMLLKRGAEKAKSLSSRSATLFWRLDNPICLSTRWHRVRAGEHRQARRKRGLLGKSVGVDRGDIGERGSYRECDQERGEQRKRPAHECLADERGG